MNAASFEERRRLEGLDRTALESLQVEKFNRLLKAILADNAFYVRKFGGVVTEINAPQELVRLPMTSKVELQANRDKSFAANHTYDLEAYTRFHQTSGTGGQPMTLLDTAADWQWWIDCWQFVLDSAGITPQDRALLAFSFGPFIGFWSAFDALTSRGTLTIPGGGLSTLARLELIHRNGVNVLLCTPTYALHMAEVAAKHQIKLTQTPIEKLIVAGEPGGSVPAFRERIERSWNATVFDHAGATEVGPWGYPNTQRTGMHVLESEFIAEFISVETDQLAAPGELAHLVLTSLGRIGCPLIRYRTGDLVRPNWPDDEVNRFVLLKGGVLGRADDMMIIRGVNIFPSSIEQILHGFPEIVEYRMIAGRRGEMDELTVEIEDRLMQPERVSEELRLRLGLKVDVRCVPTMSLPRFDGKGKRFVDERKLTEE